MKYDNILHGVCLIKSHTLCSIYLFIYGKLLPIKSFFFFLNHRLWKKHDLKSYWSFWWSHWDSCEKWSTHLKRVETGPAVCSGNVPVATRCSHTRVWTLVKVFWSMCVIFKTSSVLHWMLRFQLLHATKLLRNIIHNCGHNISSQRVYMGLKSHLR